MRNTAVLFFALIVTKFIGAALKIPLANILGGTGMGYFSTAYSVFSPVYAIFAGGLSTVITRTVARDFSCGRYSDVRAVRKASVLLSIALGIVGTAVTAALAVPCSRIISGADECVPAILAIAPAVLFCCVTSAVRGYFEGLGNMFPTALSQITEAAVKAALGLGLSYAVIARFSATGADMSKAVPFAAAAAIVGVSVSELCGTILVCIRTCFSDGITKQMLSCSPIPQRKRTLIKNIFCESLPVSVSVLVISMSGLIDLLTVSPAINNSVVNNTAYFINVYIYGITPGVSLSELGTFLYGTYTGIVSSLSGLIPALTALLCKSALPSVCAACAGKVTTKAKKKIVFLLASVTAISVPCGAVIGVFAEPVLNILYSSRPAEAAVSVVPLEILGYGGFALSLAGAFVVIFQAIGKSRISLGLMITAAAVKFFLNLILIRIPELNISGAALSGVLSYLIADVAGIILLVRELCHKSERTNISLTKRSSR